jgi:hypothetical protein
MQNCSQVIENKGREFRFWCNGGRGAAILGDRLATICGAVLDGMGRLGGMSGEFLTQSSQRTQKVGGGQAERSCELANTGEDSTGSIKLLSVFQGMGRIERWTAIGRGQVAGHKNEKTSRLSASVPAVVPPRSKAVPPARRLCSVVLRNCLRLNCKRVVREPVTA